MNTEDLRAFSLMTAAGFEEVASILETSSATLPSSWSIANTWADELRDRASKRKSKRFTIMIMGEFKRGKSTLLNALLGAKILPQKINPCTAIVTRIIYGPEPRVKVVFGDGRHEEAMSLKEFESRYSLEVKDTEKPKFSDEDEEQAFYEEKVKDRFGHIEEAIIEYPSDICRDGVELVDTPGLSEHDDREQRTLDALRDADAVLMTLSAMQQLNKRERRVIEQRLLPFRAERKLFFPINHWNLLLQTVVDPTDDEEVRETFLKQEEMIDLHVRPLVGEMADSRIFRINALGALQCRIKGDTTQIDETGVPSMESAIRKFLSDERPRAERSGDVLLLRVTRDDVNRKIQMDIRGLTTPLEALEEEYGVLKLKLESLRAHLRHIVNLIQARSAELETKLCDSLDMHLKLEIEEKLNGDSRDFDLGKAGSMWGRLGGAFDWFRKHENKTSTQINEHLTRTVKDYINPKIELWKDTGAKPVMKESMDALAKALEAELKDYGKEVDEITHGHGGLDAINNIVRNAFLQLVPKGGQEIKSFGLDLSPLLAGVLVDVMAHITFHTTLNTVLPGIGLLISAALMLWRSDKIDKNTRESMAKAIRDGMPQLRISLHGTIRGQIREAFTRVAAGINKGIEQQILVLDASLRDMIEQKKQKQFDADSQKAILESFAKTFNGAVDTLIGKLTA